MSTAQTRPYGSWPSPITLDQVVAAGRSAFAPWLDGEDLYLLESRPADAGRVTILRRASGRHLPRRDPGGLERAHARPRVRRRRVHRARRRAGVQQLRRQPALPRQRPGCGAHAHHQLQRAAVRGPGAGPAARPGHRGPRGPHPEQHGARERDRGRVARGRHGHDARRRPRVLRQPAPGRHRQPARVDLLGSPGDALGRHVAVRRGRGGGRLDRRRAPRRGRPGRVGAGPGLGARRLAAAAVRPDRLVERLPLDGGCRRPRGAGAHGGRLRRCAVGVRAALAGRGRRRHDRAGGTQPRRRSAARRGGRRPDAACPRRRDRAGWPAGGRRGRAT